MRRKHIDTISLAKAWLRSQRLHILYRALCTKSVRSTLSSQRDRRIVGSWEVEETVLNEPQAEKTYFMCPYTGC